MAASLSTALDVGFSIQRSDRRKPIFLTKSSKQNPRKKFLISCNSSSKSAETQPEPSPAAKAPSLSEQLKPLAATTLSSTVKDQTHFLSKPKSTWVNPTKPKRSVLSLQRQRRSIYSYNPKIKELELFAEKLNDCGDNEDAFMAVLEGIPIPPTRENSLLILKSLRPWQKTHLFFNWIKSKNLFPLETVFYNVTMKSLRFGRQFDLIEELANEMVSNEIPLDNITYSTIISCAKRCSLFDKAVEWFSRVYKTGLMPDEVTYSAILDVYAKLGKVEEVLSLYERGLASGWKPDAIAFSVLAKMYGETGDYDGIQFVLQEMKSQGVQPNLIVYNTLLEAMGKAGKPGLARSLFEEMLELGLTPNEKTLTCLAKIYGKARWAKDALHLWEEMRSKKWPMDLILYNTLLNMCADIGLVEEAEMLFEDMKKLRHSRPDSWSYTAMLNIYGSGGDVDKAMELFKEMTQLGIELNVMGCTSLLQCLGRGRRIDDLTKVFIFSVEKGIKVDDRLCGSLLSVVAMCESGEDADKVLACLNEANPRLFAFLRLIQEEETDFDCVKEEFRIIMSYSSPDARRPFCNCLIDICRNKLLHERAHELLYLGTVYGLYPGLHNKTVDEWSLDVRSLSVGAAQTALEEWIGTLAKLVKREEALPGLFFAQTGTGTHKFSQGLANDFALHLEKLAVPFKKSEDKAGCFVSTREELLPWLQSKIPSSPATA